MNPKFVTAYGPKKRFPFSNAEGETGQTQQSFKKECDINFIMRKYQKTSALQHVNNHQPEYGFVTSDDFRESLDIVKKAQTMFEELPSSIRSKFENSPAQFLEFVQNPENASEMVEMGLAEKKHTSAQENEETLASVLKDALEKASEPTVEE